MQSFKYLVASLTCLENLDESTESGEDSTDEDDQVQALTLIILVYYSGILWALYYYSKP